MDDLPRLLRRYLRLVCLAGLGATAAAWVAAGGGASVAESVALLFGVAMAGCFPVHQSPRTKLATETAFLVAAALACPLPTAMLIALVGTAAAHLVRRASPEETAFNAAQAALCAGAGALVFAMTDVHGAGPRRVAAALAAVALMHGVSTLLVAAAGALQVGEPVARFWWDGLWLDAPEQAALALAGAVLALAVASAPLAVGALDGVVFLAWLSAHRRPSRGRERPADDRQARSGSVLHPPTTKPGRHPRTAPVAASTAPAPLGRNA